MCRSRFSYFRTPELGSPGQKYWPCKSNSVRLGSSPRSPRRVGGLRAVGRGSGHRASHDSLLQAAGGSGLEPPVDEMNQLLMGLVIATQRSFHLLAKRIEKTRGV